MLEQCQNLTIVIPTLNARKTIRTTLESLAPLRELGAKIVIVDSYSEDGTLEAVSNLVDQIIQCPKGNMYAAINAGITWASTLWVAYLNADDIIFPDAIIKTINSIDKDIDMIYGDVDFIDLHGRFLHSYKFPGPQYIIPLAASNISAISPIGTIFKKSMWKNLNGFDTTYRYSADFDFMLRAVLNKYHLYKISRPTIGAFRLHGKQLSQESSQPCLQENYKIIERLDLRVSSFRKLTSKLLFKAGNFWEFVIRILRHRRISGKTGISECITPPDYQN